MTFDMEIILFEATHTCTPQSVIPTKLATSCNVAELRSTLTPLSMILCSNWWCYHLLHCHWLCHCWHHYLLSENGWKFFMGFGMDVLSLEIILDLIFNSISSGNLFVCCRLAPMASLKIWYAFGNILEWHRLQTSLAIHLEWPILPCLLTEKQL